MNTDKIVDAYFAPIETYLTVTVPIVLIVMFFLMFILPELPLSTKKK